MTRRPIVLPELGLTDVVCSLWLVDVGTRVRAGDRIIEIRAEGVTVDLPAPVEGIFVKQCVEEDDPLAVGQALGWINDDGE